MPVVAVGAVAAVSSIVAVTGLNQANAAENVAAAVPAQPVVLTAAQQKALVKKATIAKYGVYPLPVKEAHIKKYKLKKKALREIAKARSLAKTSKAKRIRQCESGGNYSINTGNGYYGAYQFDYGTWLANGGGRYARTANKAPSWAQDHIMWKTYQARGWSPWACQ